MPDLILCDLKMPRVAGDELLRHIRADARLANVPVVVFSSSGEAKDVKLCEDCGASEYACKPVGFEDYEERLVDVVSRHLPTADQP